MFKFDIQINRKYAKPGGNLGKASRFLKGILSDHYAKKSCWNMLHTKILNAWPKTITLHFY